MASCSSLAGQGCEDRTLPPAGQLVIYVDTDAPIGSMSAPQNILETNALFDRLRIEVIRPDGSLACDDCARDFVVSDDDLENGKLSFGVKLPEARSDYRARIRFYVDATRSNGLPRFDTSIDGLFALPPHTADGIVEVTAFLAFETTGQPVDLDQSPPQPLTVGRAFKNARAVPKIRPQCIGAQHPGEVCVPGGTFWAKRTDIARAGSDTWHPITMSPFFLDEHEVTVAEMRLSKRVTDNDPKRSIGGDPGLCTFTSKREAFEQLPVTCITKELAAAYCKDRSSGIPTGAQFEYTRGKLASQTYVWGLDSPTCFDAVWSRGKPDQFNECAALGVGPQPTGRGARDRLTLPTGNVLDLAGNVGELISDWPPDCSQVGLLVDPTCGPPLGRAVAGSFHDDRTFLQTPARVIAPDPVNPTIGFRCSRPDEAPADE